MGGYDQARSANEACINRVAQLNCGPFWIQCD